MSLRPCRFMSGRFLLSLFGMSSLDGTFRTDISDKIQLLRPWRQFVDFNVADPWHMVEVVRRVPDKQFLYFGDKKGTGNQRRQKQGSPHMLTRKKEYTHTLYPCSNAHVAFHTQTQTQTRPTYHRQRAFFWVSACCRRECGVYLLRTILCPLPQQASFECQR